MSQLLGSQQRVIIIFVCWHNGTLAGWLVGKVDDWQVAMLPCCHCDRLPLCHHARLPSCQCANDLPSPINDLLPKNTNLLINKQLTKFTNQQNLLLIIYLFFLPYPYAKTSHYHIWHYGYLAHFQQIMAFSLNLINYSIPAIFAAHYLGGNFCR